MTKPEKLTPVDVSEETGVPEDDVAEVMHYLVKEGWMLGRFVQFNTRSESNLDLPEE